MECTGWIVKEMVDILVNQSKKLLTRFIEHLPDSIKDNWESSGDTEHIKECHRQFSRIHPRTIVVMLNMYKRKVREALEITDQNIDISSLLYFSKSCTVVIEIIILLKMLYGFKN